MKWKFLSFSLVFYYFHFFVSHDKLVVVVVKSFLYIKPLANFAQFF